MEVKAKLSHLHIAPRKVRLVVDLIRGLDTQEAIAKLTLTAKRAARPVNKLLKSAIANAEHNFSLDKNNLFIKEIRADEGPRLKRWQPRAFGRAYQILKRSSHVSIILEERVPGKKIQGVKSDKQLERNSDTLKSTFKPKIEQTEIQKFPVKDEMNQEADQEKKVWNPSRIAKRTTGRNEDKSGMEAKKRTGRLNKFFQRKSV